MKPQSLLARVLRSATVLAVALAGLAGCDSSSRINPYVPTRLMSFGDDLSAVRADGLKVNVNGGDCSVNPLWNQQLATAMGLTLPNCPVGGSSNGVMGAAINAKVADIVAQVATARAANPGAFVSSTLVTLQGGLWDVIEAYNTWKTDATQYNALLAQMVTKGHAMGDLVNSIADNGNGPRVIYGTVPDLGCSPRAYADGLITGSQVCQNQASRTDPLTVFTATFNDALRNRVLNDGRYAGLVIFDDKLRSMTTTTPNPLFFSIYGLANVTGSLNSSSCNTGTPATPTTTCTTSTLVTNATSTNWLWAFDVIPGPAFHNQIAAGTGGAIFRARNNPF
ncbi:hypothetical protein ACWA7J_20060 [Leptothrix sp. BB-4]